MPTTAPEAVHWLAHLALVAAVVFLLVERWRQLPRDRWCNSSTLQGPVIPAARSPSYSGSFESAVPPPDAPQPARAIHLGRRLLAIDSEVRTLIPQQATASRLTRMGTARLSTGAPGNPSTPTRVLITGITGMIGSAVARYLDSQARFEIHGLVRWRSNVRNLKKVLRRVSLHYGDIDDPHRMRTLIEEVRPHRVFHFAAQAYNGVSWASPAYTLTTNIIGTLNLLEPLRALNMRDTVVVVAGSSAEYGRTADRWAGPLPEEAPLAPVTPYGVSKVATELLARQYFLSYGLRTVIPRLFLHVGTGHTENQALQNFCLQVAEIEAGLRPPVVKVGDINTERDVTDIRDSAPVIARLAEVGVPGEAYNVASGKSIPMSYLLQLAISLSRVKNITVEHDKSRLRAYDEKVLLGDNTKLCNLTGWVPRPNLRRTVLSILNFWREELTLRYGAGTRDKRPRSH